MPGLPVTWPDLLADRETISRYEERLGYFLQDAADDIYAPEELLISGGETLMALALLRGPKAAAPGLDALEKAGAGQGGVQRAIVTARPDLPLAPIDVLTAANVGAICGREAFDASRDDARTLLALAADVVRTIGDGMRYRGALAATAHGLPELAARLAAGKPRTGAFQPGESFEANLQALIHYLVQADAAGASEADVEPAIRGAVEAFPFHLGDELLDWGDMGWLGRILFHRFGKAPIGEVAERLHEYVRRF